MPPLPKPAPQKKKRVVVLDEASRKSFLNKKEQMNLKTSNSDLRKSIS